MSEIETKHQADIWAQAALARLKQDGLAPVPENFTVMYNYFAGNNSMLKGAIDGVLTKNEGKLTQNLVSEIFQSHLGVEAEHRILKEANASIEAELKAVMSVLNTNMAGANNYNQSLNEFSGSLQKAPSLDEIRTAVTKLAQETRTMVQQNERLQTQLAESTEQLVQARTNLDEVKRDSLVDPLTEIGNRKYFNNELARATAEATEEGSVLSLLIIDIDFFKKFNDTYGHLVGDQVLRLVARTLVENLKGRDIIARYGGEEFVILLPQTRAMDAERVGNLLRNTLASKQIKRKNTNESLGVITISIGATEYLPHEDTDGFIARADAALYDAKQTGRNKIVVRATENNP